MRPEMVRSSPQDEVALRDDALQAGTVPADGATSGNAAGPVSPAPEPPVNTADVQDRDDNSRGEPRQTTDLWATKAPETDNGNRLASTARRRSMGIAAFLRSRRSAVPPPAPHPSEASFPVLGDAAASGAVPSSYSPGDDGADPEATVKGGLLLSPLAPVDPPVDPPAPEVSAPGSAGSPGSAVSPGSEAGGGDGGGLEAPSSAGPPTAGGPEATAANTTAAGTAAADSDQVGTGGGETKDARPVEAAGKTEGAEGASGGPEELDEDEIKYRTSRLLIPIEQAHAPAGRGPQEWLNMLRTGTFANSPTGRTAIALVAAVIVMIAGGAVLFSVGPGAGQASSSDAGFPAATGTDGTSAATPSTPAADPTSFSFPGAPLATPSLHAEASANSTTRPVPPRRPATAAPAPQPTSTPPPAQAPTSPAAPPSTRPACYDQLPPLLASWLDQMGRC